MLKICFLKRCFTTLMPLMLAVLVLVAVQPAFAASPQAVRFYNKGIDAYGQGETDKALGFFQKAVDADNQYADAYYNLGSIWYQQGNYTQARDAFGRTVELNPSDVQARYNMGLTLEKLAQYDDAVRYFMQVPPSHEKYQKAKEKVAQLKPYLKNPETATIQPQPVRPKASPPAKIAVGTFAKGFYGPTGMTIGPGGFMYVANYSKNAIYKVGASGEKALFAQSEQLQGPIGLTYDTQTGDMYVANYLKNSVSRVNAEGQVSVLASGLKKPYNLFLDTTNHVLYVSEQETNTISKIQLY